MKLFRFIEDKPLSPWGYVLYSLLFLVPIFGFIFLLVIAVGSVNQHRKNFARSWICAFIVLLLLGLVLFILALLGVLAPLLALIS